MRTTGRLIARGRRQFRLMHEVDVDGGQMPIGQILIRDVDRSHAQLFAFADTAEAVGFIKSVLDATVPLGGGGSQATAADLTALHSLLGHVRAMAAAIENRALISPEGDQSCQQS